MSDLAIVLTGPEGDQGSLASGLRAIGVEVHRLPLLEVGPPADGGPLRNAARALSLYGCIAFPSPRAVDALAGALADAGMADRGREAIAVGEGTAARADEAGFVVVVAGGGHGGAGAAALLDAVDRERYPVRGVRILLPCSERARPELHDGLRARGAKVDAVPAYAVRAVANPGARMLGLHRVVRLRGDGPPPMLVASPSAAEVLAAVLHEEPRGLPPLLAIGRTTERALEGLGLPVAARAAAPTPEGIRDALRTIGSPTP